MNVEWPLCHSTAEIQKYVRNVNVSCHHCSTEKMSTMRKCHCYFYTVV